FETSVEFYGSREPYSDALFAAVADRLHLAGRERLIDLGCGPAQLALGPAPFVQEVVGVDIEPAMLELAHRNAEALGIALQLVASRVEDLPSSIGNFELVTVGRALHWMDRAATLDVLDRIVAPSGHIAICAATADSDVNRWVSAYRAVRQAWTVETEEQRYRIDHDAWFAPSRFRRIDELRLVSTRTVTVAEIVRRSLSMSTTAPAVLGDRRSLYESEIARAVSPFAHGGMLDEHVACTAAFFG
ncbi:MAG: class I SAM-dependent methyltransferase, partial [Acidobacteriales bacterium]|nr:class I SAM-dependent methyltransferase [Terriglobales bacterium]